MVGTMDQEPGRPEPSLSLCGADPSDQFGAGDSGRPLPERTELRAVSDHHEAPARHRLHLPPGFEQQVDPLVRNQSGEGHKERRRRLGQERARGRVHPGLDHPDVLLVHTDLLQAIGSR